jgi:antirestriction protein ArdC
MSKTKAPPTKAPRRDLYQEVTDKIVAAIEAGTAPWQKPWTELAELGLPMNGASERHYRGINTMLLFMASHGYTDNRWFTYKQASELGAQVRKAEKSTPVYFFKMLQASERDGGGGGDSAKASPKTGTPSKDDKPRQIPFLTEYRVFNASQIDGLAPQERPERTWTPIEAVNEVVARLNPDIRYGGSRAFYAPGPGRDFIQMPHEGAFGGTDSTGAADLAGTLLHEISHWTGAGHRLNRQFGVWGSEDYAREEIRAELAAAMMSAELGVPTTTENHAAYIGSWVKRLKEDKFEIFRASRDAGKIADFVTGRLVLDTAAEPAIVAVASPTPALQPAVTPTAPQMPTPISIAALKALMAIKPKRAPSRAKLANAATPSTPQPAPAM